MRRSLIFTDPEDEVAAPRNDEVTVILEGQEDLEGQEAFERQESPGPKDEEVSADVDRLMDRITELKKLTMDSLEVDVERASPEPEDDSEFSFSPADCKRDAVIHENSSMNSCRSSPRSSKTSKASAGLAESAFAIARLEAVIQQVQKRGKRDKNRERSGSRDKDDGSSFGSSESGVELSVDDVLDDFRHRIANMEKVTQAWNEQFEESETRIKTEVLAHTEQALQKKLYTFCQAFESKLQKHLVAALQSFHETQNKEKAVAASGEVPASVGEQKASGKTSLQASSPRERQTGINDTPNTAELERFRDLKAQVLADVEGKMVTLQNEISTLEENLKIYVCEQLQAETRARMGGHQEIMKEIDKEAKARLFDGINIRKMIISSNGAYNDVSSAGSGRVSEHPESCARYDVPVHLKNERGAEFEAASLFSKESFDLQIGNVAGRCASLTERLSSGSCNVDGQVSIHLMQLSYDLEKVAMYLSGTLQPHLESVTKRMEYFHGKLETLTKELLPPAPKTASEASTLDSSPAARSSTVRNAPVLPAVARMLSAGEALKMLIPNSASPWEAEEVCLGSPEPDEREVCTGAPSSTARELCLGTFSSKAPEFYVGTPRRSAGREVSSDTTCSTGRELCLGTPQSAAREVCSGTPISTARESCVGTPHSAARSACSGTPCSTARELCVGSPQAAVRVVPPLQHLQSPAYGEHQVGPVKNFAPSLRALGPGTPSSMHRNVDV